MNLARKERQRGAPAAQVAAELARWFRRDLWPWERLPEVYDDPRSLDEVGEPAFLHAKCIMIDDEPALVTSANLTETAHVRNIEEGVLDRGGGAGGGSGVCEGAIMTLWETLTRPESCGF